MQYTARATMKFFSAFSGIGGFDEGIKRVLPEAQCVGYSEIDKYAVKIYERHFPKNINYGDIRRIDTKTLPDFDMLCGGFPCQDFSIAGKRAGLEGCRSGLFYELIRIVQEKKPRRIFLENVKGLFSSDKGRDFARILIALDEVGYDVEWQCLNSKDFGVPQNRERVFIIGHLRGQSWKPVFPIGQSESWCNGTQGEKQSDGKRIRSDNSSVIAQTLRQRDYKGGNNLILQPNNFAHKAGDGLSTRKHTLTDIVPSLQANCGGTQQSYVLRNISNTIDSTGILREPGHRVSQNDSIIRRLTPLECERLQGYPDGWTSHGSDGKPISDTQRYKCLGNAVTVNVIEAIVKRIV